MMVYPEGTRKPDGEKLPLKTDHDAVCVRKYAKKVPGLSGV